jgi:N-acetylmuramoyl-L-alanine amidase
MPYTISADHRLKGDGVSYRASPNVSGLFTAPPSLLVVHDTAGSSLESSVAWMCNKASKASAHVCIGIDGEVVQMVPFNRIAWHAGQSVYRGRPWCNGYAIGIEHDNPGILSPSGKAWFGAYYGSDDTEPFDTPQHGRGRALVYTEEQIMASAEIIAALVSKYPSLVNLEPHYVISPGRKYDTTPIYPLQQMRGIVTGLADSPPGHGGEGGDSRGPWGVAIVDVNCRRWPSNADNIVGVIPAGTEVNIVRSGFYESGFPYAQWHLVQTPALEGWVHSAYIDER